MPPTAVSLARMVDLAVGTPEVGVVNFNVLHSLLHAVLQRLDIADVKADLPDFEDADDRAQTLDSGFDNLTSSKLDSANSRRDMADVESDSGVTGITQSASEIGADHEKSSGLYKSKAIPVTRLPYHSLEEKIERLERQMAALRSLPSTSELMAMTSGGYEQQDNKVPRPVADMWQSMQLSRKVDANTQGVSKLMSLVEDLMREMQQLKDSNEEMKKKLQNVAFDADKLNELLNKMNELEKQANEFQQRIDNLPDEEFYNGFVTWAALEDALKGLRQQYDSLSQPQPQPQPQLQPQQPTIVERVVIEIGNQTDPTSRPASRRQSRASTPGPSAQLQELLERLGRLHEQHDALEERVAHLETEVKNKVNREELDGVSSDVTNQLKSMLEELKALRDAHAKDQEAFSRTNQILQRLQNELDRLNIATQRLSDDVSNHGSDIERLHNATKDLDDKKADKDFVLNEINAKADKEHLDSKVNRNQFDLTCSELNQMINDLINKLLGTEGEWKTAVGHLSSEIDGKMDRLEFGPFRDELERQLRALANKLSTLQTGGNRALTDDEAAGIRKQLLQRFHCISCDKPLDMAPQRPQPSLPGQPGLPENRSMRPYLVYDLDNIRQYTRIHSGTEVPASDAYATARACGGSHTMTFPHRRVTRLQHVSHQLAEDAISHQAIEPSYLNKNQIGTNNNKLPNVYAQPPKSARRQPTASSQLPHLPTHSGTVSRPSSARLTPRPVSAEVHASPRLETAHRSMTAAAGDRHGSLSPQQSAQDVVIQLPKLSGAEKQTTPSGDIAHMTDGYDRGDAFQRMNDSAPIVETEYVSANDDGRLQGDEEEHHQKSDYDDEANELIATQDNGNAAYGADEFEENGNVNMLDGGDN